jgi:ribonuclease HI
MFQDPTRIKGADAGSKISWIFRVIAPHPHPAGKRRDLSTIISHPKKPKKTKKDGPEKQKPQSIKTPLVIAVDGSYASGPEAAPTAGWAAVFETGEVYISAAAGIDCAAAEISAAILALETAPQGRPLIIVSDFVLLSDFMNGRADTKCCPDLWRKLKCLVALRFPATVSFQWVKGHSGDKLNVLAHQHATKARKSISG